MKASRLMFSDVVGRAGDAQAALQASTTVTPPPKKKTFLASRAALRFTFVFRSHAPSLLAPSLPDSRHLPLCST